MPQEELSFTYFPENYRWSHGLLIGLNMAPWGGAEIGEINRIGLRLKNCVGDDNAWFREWAREARTVEDRGRERIADGRTLSGAQYLQRASAYYHVGERFLQPKSKEGLDAYMRGVDCLREAATGRAFGRTAPCHDGSKHEHARHHRCPCLLAHCSCSASAFRPIPARQPPIAARARSVTRQNRHKPPHIR